MIKNKKMLKGKTKSKVSFQSGKKVKVQSRSSSPKPQSASILVKIKRLFTRLGF